MERKQLLPFYVLLAGFLTASLPILFAADPTQVKVPKKGIVKVDQLIYRTKPYNAGPGITPPASSISKGVNPRGTEVEIVAVDSATGWYKLGNTPGAGYWSAHNCINVTEWSDESSLALVPAVPMNHSQIRPDVVSALKTPNIPLLELTEETDVPKSLLPVVKQIRKTKH